MPDQVSLADIEAAAERLHDVARDLPLLDARWLEELVGGEVRLVPENLQRAGSFKIRGAYNRISQLSDDEKARGVVAASAGNHAQGVALAAARLGVQATVFMPEGASIPKLTATRGYGADVILGGASIDDAIEAALDFASSTGAVVIHPYDNADVVAGQGTLGLEILAKMPEVRTIVVCTGGGGLLAGITLAVKATRPDVRVIGVQAHDAAAYPASLAAGKPIRRTNLVTMADGIAVGLPGDIPFVIIDDLVDEIRTVSEDELSSAVVRLLERSKLLVEPAGAAAVAAVMAEPRSFEPPVAVMLSGGNVDPLVLLRLIRHGLVAGGRYLTLVIRMSDRPGSLARLLQDIGSRQANVVDIEHHRDDERLRLDEVEIVVHVETRGPEHCAALIDHLRAGGYEVEVR